MLDALTIQEQKEILAEWLLQLQGWRAERWEPYYWREHLDDIARLIKQIESYKPQYIEYKDGTQINLF